MLKLLSLLAVGLMFSVPTFAGKAFDSASTKIIEPLSAGDWLFYYVEGPHLTRLAKTAVNSWSRLIHLPARKLDSKLEAAFIIKVGSVTPGLASNLSQDSNGKTVLTLAPDLTDTEAIATMSHAIGHLIGLAHTNNTDSIMQRSLQDKKVAGEADHDAASELGWKDRPVFETPSREGIDPEILKIIDRLDGPN